MQQPLQAHIVFLEDRVQELLNALTMGNISPIDRERIERELRLAIAAAQSFREAYEMELAIHPLPSRADLNRP
jgi:hypothetical protein